MARAKPTEAIALPFQLREVYPDGESLDANAGDEYCPAEPDSPLDYEHQGLIPDNNGHGIHALLSSLAEFALFVSHDGRFSQGTYVHTLSRPQHFLKQSGLHYFY